MKQIYTFLLITVTVCAVFLGPATITRAGNEKFVPLFNGKNLDGWANINCAPETWTVRDGMIICTGFPTGLLRTDKQYENYILELEFRHMKERGNAGLFIHSDAMTAVGTPFTRAVECQVMDGNGGDVFSIHGATMAQDNPKPVGYARSFPTENRIKPAGQWNHYRVVSKDGTVTLAVNGKMVTRAFHLNPRKGYICLESEGSEVHFRNIRIHELPSSNPPPELVAEEYKGFRPLYNGVDLRGWKQTVADKGHWLAKNYILEYDGKSAKSEKYKNHLQSEEEFENFVLIVDWRLTRKPKLNEVTMNDVKVVLPDGTYAKDENGEEIRIRIFDAGDSGIFLRGSGKGQVNIWCWPTGSGEFWGYRNDKSMPAEIRKGVTPILNADKPLGKWNRFEITVIDDWVTVVLNGKTVIRQAQLPGIPERGPILLQNHGDPIQFANIYVKELK
ncbi:MAG: 3-keto-disaccharide hydrolase [Planctomycetota bacterium]|jgi:hypothetical protein